MSMSTGIIGQEIQTISILKEIEIAAPIEIAFEAMLEEVGPGGEMPGGKPFPMVIEPWPGGRWYRDLGDNSGHLWGHVQVIKPPTLLELCGPMFMSFPGVNHVQYRLIADGEGTRLMFTHRAMGPIPEEVREGVGHGWDHGLKRISEIAGRLVIARRTGGKG
jgi:Activator of Hsp90 ATPase homolog 1-like protein